MRINITSLGMSQDWGAPKKCTVILVDPAGPSCGKHRQVPWNPRNTWFFQSHQGRLTHLWLHTLACEYETMTLYIYTYTRVYTNNMYVYVYVYLHSMPAYSKIAGGLQIHANPVFRLT